MSKLSQVALGAWGGGRFMHYGVELDDQQMRELFKPEKPLQTVLTADVYGSGEADRIVGEAIAGTPREDVFLVGAIGHDFYDGERRGAKGFPRFTDPALRGPEQYRDYIRMATQESLKRCGTDYFDLLLLHNPDHVGYTSPIVWDALSELKSDGLVKSIGIAPGPANGFTLDILNCLDLYGDRIDAAMIILGPLEPWPGGLVLDACEKASVDVICRVVDYGGTFWGDLNPETPLVERDHRKHRPAGWIERGLETVEQVAAIGERHGLTPMQTAAQWALAQPAVTCVVPTLIQELGESARPVLDKKAELAALPTEIRLTAEEIQQISKLGDNAGCMALKGASPVYDGEDIADQWQIGEAEAAAAKRWGIDPEKQLTLTM